MTAIEWTDKTWNPVAGCSIVSPGCANCYAMKMAARIEAMGGVPRYAGLTQATKAGAVWTGKIVLAPSRILTAPLRWREPSRVFVNSMGDLFHEDVPGRWLDPLFDTMESTPRHTFQILTKRADRMRAYLSRRWIYWTPPNIWIGVSAEDQTRLDERWPHLRDTPAAVRFISYEPAIGPLDMGLGRGDSSPSWVICGGESGPGARRADPAWFRDVLHQCRLDAIAFYMKQMGGPVKSRMPAIPDDLMIREFPR